MKSIAFVLYVGFKQNFVQIKSIGILIFTRSAKDIIPFKDEVFIFRPRNCGMYYGFSIPDPVIAPELFSNVENLGEKCPLRLISRKRLKRIADDSTPNSCAVLSINIDAMMDRKVIGEKMEYFIHHPGLSVILSTLFIATYCTKFGRIKQRLETSAVQS